MAACSQSRSGLFLRGVRVRPFWGAVMAVVGTVARWHHRAQQRRQLAALDARMLRDIGVSQAAAAEEARKPFWRP